MATMTLDQLVAQLTAAYGSALRAVVLYGSAAAGEYDPKRSDRNVLVLVDELPLERIRAASAAMQAWTGAGNPPPLTMTTAEWRRSADIFPMEYADILERHKVLHGEPPFDGLVVAARDLRHELEHQAMGKLLQLRAGVLTAGADSKRQGLLMEQSLSTIMVILRAVLRLHGESPSTEYEAVARAAAARAGLDAESLVRVVRHVRGGERLQGAQAVTDALAGYLRAMEQLVAHLDRFHHDAGGATPGAAGV